jgi:UMF1 family MFS transporter
VRVSIAHPRRKDARVPLFDPSALNPGVTRKEAFAWAGYDFANSGYTTVVLTAVFAQYFTGVVAKDLAFPTTAWTWILGISNALVLVASPLIGAYADVHARKKHLLLICTIGCVLGTAALALAGRGDVGIAAAATIVSNFFFMIGVGLVAAFLPELARPQSLGKVSGWGWSFGYVGGLLTLGLCLAYVIWAQGAGQDATRFVPVTLLLTAAIFAAAAAPTFLVLRERATPQPGDRVLSLFSASWGRLWQTLSQVRRYRDFGVFLLCGAFYQAGVAVVIALAAIYAADVMKFSFDKTMMLILVVNVTAAAGAFVFGYVQDAIGHRKALALTLLTWLAMTWVAAVAATEGVFWIAANLAGLAMGSSQSAGRAMTGVFAPKDRIAEFYGLWTLATQVASIVGPLTYGAVMMATANNHRTAIMFTGAFFVVGLVLIAFIDIERGRRAAGPA